MELSLANFPPIPAPEGVYPFKTEYPVTRIYDGAQFNPQGVIWAHNTQEALAIAKSRGLRETVYSDPGFGEQNAFPPAHQVLAWSPRQCFCLAEGFSTCAGDLVKHYAGCCHHALNWLGFLAAKSGVVIPEEITGDYGMIHTYAHFHQFRDLRMDIKFVDFLREVQRIERLVPGYQYWDKPTGCSFEPTLELDKSGLAI